MNNLKILLYRYWRLDAMIWFSVFKTGKGSWGKMAINENWLFYDALCDNLTLTISELSPLEKEEG